MTLTNTATLIPGDRVGNLRQVAHPAPEGWEQGLEVHGLACVSPVRLGNCAVIESPAESPGDPEAPQDLPEGATFKTFTARIGLQCSTLSRAPLPLFARSVSGLTADYALTRELFDGASTGNPSLGDAVALPAATDAIQALACLEAAAASALSGRQATIHVPPGVAAYIEPRVYRDDSGAWRTIVGNKILIGSGYTGSLIYATGEIWAASQPIPTRADVQRLTNVDTAWAEELAIVAFDPCYVASIETGVECPA